MEKFTLYICLFCNFFRANYFCLMDAVTVAALSDELVLLKRFMWKTKNQYRHSKLWKLLQECYRDTECLLKFVQCLSSATALEGKGNFLVHLKNLYQRTYIYCEMQLSTTHLMPFSLMVINMLARLNSIVDVIIESSPR